MPKQVHRPLVNVDVPKELHAEVRDLARQEQISISELLTRVVSMGLTRYRALRKYAEKRRNTLESRAHSAVD